MIKYMYNNLVDQIINKYEKSYKMKLDKAIKYIKEKYFSNKPLTRSFIDKIDVYVERTREKIAYTDGVDIFISTGYLDSPFPQISYVIIHEFLHIVFGHVARAHKFRIRGLWNIAADIMVDAVISKHIMHRRVEHIDTLLFILKKIFKKHGYHEEYRRVRLLVKQVMNEPSAWTAESIYNYLLSRLRLEDTEKFWEFVWEAISTYFAERHDWEDAEGYGLYSLAIEMRVIDEILGYAQGAKWADILRKIIVAGPVGHAILTWKRPNKRFLRHGYYYPRKSAPLIRSLAIAMDVSGSIGSDEYRRIAEEVASLVSSIAIGELHLIQFDSKIVYYERLIQPGFWDVVYSIQYRHGMGGTDFSAVFRFVEERIGYVDALVIITDGEGLFPGYVPSVRTIWVIISYEHKNIPFGEVIYV